LKLDAAISKILLSVYGYGGGAITLDSQGNIYLAGTSLANVTDGGSTLSLLRSVSDHSQRPLLLCILLGSWRSGRRIFVAITSTLRS
jgi:hypothetical protein